MNVLVGIVIVLNISFFLNCKYIVRLISSNNLLNVNDEC